MFEQYGWVRRIRKRRTRLRAASRKFRPTLDGLGRLEARCILHGGPVSAAVRPVDPAPAFPTAAIQAALAASYSGVSTTIQVRDGAIFVPSGLTDGPLVSPGGRLRV